MDKDTVLKIIQDFGRGLESHGVRIDRIVLFGSYATGTYHEGSDIDLVVVSDSFSGKGYWERREVLWDVLYEIWKPIQATPVTIEEWEQEDSMIVEFAKSGEVVYTGDGADAKHHAVKEQQTQ